MKRIGNIFNSIRIAAIASVGLLAGGCAADSPWNSPETGISGWNEDGSMNLEISFEIPNYTVSRAISETPSYDELDLWVLVFETESGNLRQAVKATKIDKDEEENCENTGSLLKYFSVALNPTDVKATLHLIATNQPDIADQIGSTGSSGGIGNENQLRSLKTDNFNEAYWSRVELDTEIMSPDDKGQAQAEANQKKIQEKLWHVLMVRNFGKISVRVTEGVDFKVDNMYLYNWSEQGSVCPYLIIDSDDNQTSDNNGFVIFFDRDPDTKKITARNYDDILATGHTGNPPAGTVINRDTPIESTDPNQDGNPEIYFYERPYRGEDRAFVIIEGHRPTDANKTMYYKIDIGKQDENSKWGEFKYYNFYRNFNYRININGVSADGYGTRQEAIDGIVFNNISASVETQNLTSISEGDQTIIVNKTSYVFTSGNMDAGWQLKGQYINGSTAESNQLEIEVEGDNFLTITDGGMQNGWKQWNVQIKDGERPTATPRQATIIVYRGKINDNEFGLYRKVTITFIDHFEIEKMDTYPGLWSDFEDVPWDWSDERREIGQGVDAPLTLFFELPQGLPEAIFPLEFTIESNRQNIQNAYVGNVTIKTVPANKSLFWDGGNGGVSSARIQLIKTVTWAEYQEVVNSNYIVRCRFLTTTDLAQDGIGGEGTTGISETTLRVYNQYFGTKDDGFKRDTKTSDPTPVMADFSSQAWASIVSTLSATNHAIFTATNNSTDGLILVEGLTTGNTRSMGSGTDASGNTYISTTNANDEFRYSVTYDGTAERTLRVEVMTTNAAGTPTAPSVTMNNGTFTLVSTNTATSPYTTYEYEAKIATSTTSQTKTVSIKPASATQQRFYKINIYPRYYEE